ncbi:MAG: hypothetical protein LC646_01050 [Xanthomonadaceae bacterium]|nr:hypothetical protein [Xanthomonadaceae bacterium]
MPTIITPLRNLLLILLCGLLLSRPAASMEDDLSLSELAMLARVGAPQLALRHLDAQQPAYAEDPVTWMGLERERVYLLRTLGDVDTVIERLAALPLDVSVDFRRWAHTEWASALLEQQRPGEALGVLRDLLWNAADAQMDTLMRWRRMVIQSYLLDAGLEDARSALVRYQQDFGAGGREWNQLRLRVLLQTERYEEMLALSTETEDAMGTVLRLAARLRSGALTAEEVHQAARRLALAGDTAPAARALAWQLAVEAARGLPPLQYIDTLEQALALPREAQPEWVLFEVTGDLLWDAWLAHGRKLGNQEQRLLGADDDWYFPATEALEKDPLRARVLFTVLSAHGSTPERRELAHEYLVSLLAALPRGEQLVQRLYLDSRRFEDSDQLPGVIRYRLIDEALEGGDLRLASRLMQDMAQPPPGADAMEWGLRRARVAIHTGQAEQGAAMLASLLEDERPLVDEQLDRWVQVVFDLQTVTAHQQAIDLFERLLLREMITQRAREILFWQADSWQALGKPARAAYLYLQSATLTDPSAMDPWAQTARYHAAQSLAEAGLLEDARRVYQTLLNSTREPGRRAMLLNEIQRLRLRAAAREVRS